MIPIDDVIKQQEGFLNIIVILGLYVIGMLSIIIGYNINSNAGFYISRGGFIAICIVNLAWLSTLIVPIPLWLGFIVSIIATMLISVYTIIHTYRESEKA